MTNPKFEPLYCSVCWAEIGQKTGEGAVPGLRCQDPACQIQNPPSPMLARDAVMVAGRRDDVAAPIIASAFGMSRQRVYQIESSYFFQEG